MKKHLSHSNAFLLEILLDLIIFAVLITISLQLFMHAHSATKRTSDLYQAVDLCETLSDLYENDDDDFSLTTKCYPEIHTNGAGYQLYLDKNFLPVTDRENAVYTIFAESESTKDSKITALNITCYDDRDREIYMLRASRYKQLTAYLFSDSRKEVAV